MLGTLNGLKSVGKLNYYLWAPRFSLCKVEQCSWQQIAEGTKDEGAGQSQQSNS